MVHTVSYYEQRNDISNPMPGRPVPVPTIHRKEYVVEEILMHRLRGRGYKFLARMAGKPRYDPTWLPTNNFVDSDGTTMECFLDLP